MSSSRLLITPEDVERILSYLDLPPSSTLPSPPFQFLTQYLPLLPSSLLEPFEPIPPSDRTSIPTIKQRRLIHATASPRPRFLSSSEGRLRWPLLWERMGGDPFPPPSHGVEEEENWVQKGFMKDVPIETSQQVKKLGGFLRGLEEEREMEGVRERKRMERRLDNVGEEFDEESDEEEEPMPDGTNGVPERPEVAEDQEEVKRLFEKKLLELFLDGLDTIDYTPIDFNDPPEGDPIAIRDAEDRYFDDEEPCRTPGGVHVVGEPPSVPDSDPKKRLENGTGDYDY
ncbi:hypothetical protein CI109_106659 [Kwoniella shandongensis]|uniref:Uncharacterized protein n=1 Tax=Kwoniella shandongensis TaxID=1734106 RepID=A0A5M6BQQ8_9TREE|nr:uncharacterized protein CI109_006397 [Kwoniella shandongensis]KAA5525228.1 hypothetical protein CI109_006397 [Kwoniella shandongensis]